jgi:hypothetical protein
MCNLDFLATYSRKRKLHIIFVSEEKEINDNAEGLLKIAKNAFVKRVYFIGDYFIFCFLFT